MLNGKHVSSKLKRFLKAKSVHVLKDFGGADLLHKNISISKEAI